MESAKNEDVTNNRQKVLARLQGRYPGVDFSDDEVLFGKISEDSDKSDKDIADYQAREKAMSDMFTADPRSASFLAAWKNGGNPFVEFVRRFGKDALDNPDMQEDIAAAHKEYMERIAKEKELEDTYQQNLKASLESIEAMQQEKGLSDDDIDPALELLSQVAADVIVGKFTPESIEMALKALHHDADVTAATAEGVVQGKNTKIEEKLRKPRSGDGTPALDGANGGVGSARTMPNLGALGRLGDNNKTIYERGGEKRYRANV